jgi:hypothetical protein
VFAVACKDPAEGSERRCAGIGTAGGTVTSHDHVLTLALRPDALEERTQVCITPAERPPEGPPSIYGAAYRVQPDIDLALNATVTYRAALPSDPAGVAVGVILREDFEAGRGRWLPLPVTRLEPENELVAGSDPRLSMYYGLCGADDCADEAPDPTSGTDTDPTTGSTTDTTSTTDASTTGEDTIDPTRPDVSTSVGSLDSSSGPGDGSSSGDTGPVGDCDDLPEPPFTITALGNVFPQPFAGIGSEDIAMTGNGTFVGLSGNELLESDADGNTSDFFAPVSAPLYGVRFNAAGDLLGVNSNTEDIDIFDGVSQEMYADTNLVFGNGLYADNAGDVWVTDFGGNAIYRVDSDLSIDLISDTTQQPNGIFFDEDRSILYWSRYGTGELHALPIDGAGDPGASALVTDLAGQTDGITMDACGHIYAVDQGGGAGLNPCRIDRVHLDAAGDLAPEGVVEIAGAGDLGNGCSNAQFGYGFGDANDRSLFVTATPGDIYVVEVGVEGYPIP